AKIGTIASVDIPKLVQRPPGGKIRFESIGVQEAQVLLREEAHLFEMLALKVRRPSADGISPRRTARQLYSERLATIRDTWTFHNGDRDVVRPVPSY
ncbi:hypothetical protein NE553_15990, partial [Eggerthella lenta]|nr:hypothetical protein [Eggerthella lenta]